MAEEQKMLEFLSVNGITTLTQLKDIFRHYQNVKVDEDLVFVQETKPEAAPCISQEKLNMLIETSSRNKEILLNKLSKNSAGTSNPRPVAQQIGTIDVPGRSVVNEGCTTKNVTSLPMRNRHKHTHQNQPYQQEKRCQQQWDWPLLRQACEGNPSRENNQHNLYQQYNYHGHYQNRYEGVQQNITGYNDGSGHRMTTWLRGGGINSIGHTVPGMQPLASTTVNTVVPQQQWPSATSVAHTGHSGYNDYAQFHLAPQGSQQTRTQSSRPEYNPD